MDLQDYFEATWDARGKLLDSASLLTPGEWTREFPFSWKSIRNLFAHIIEVEGSWGSQNIEEGEWHYPTDSEIERRYATTAMTRARSDEIAAQTRRILKRYVPARLHEIRVGRQMDGTEAPFTVEQILTHVVTHELRHQGQLQAMLRMLGKAAPNADWI